MAQRITQVVLPSEASTTTRTSQQQVTPDQAEVLLLFVDATTVAAVETITPTLQIFNPTSNEYEPYCAFSAINAAGNKVYVLALGAVDADASANVETKALPVPTQWRLVATHSLNGSHQYSVTAIYA